MQVQVHQMPVTLPTMAIMHEGMVTYINLNYGNLNGLLIG